MAFGSCCVQARPSLFGGSGVVPDATVLLQERIAAWSLELVILAKVATLIVRERFTGWGFGWQAMDITGVRPR
jgi:hypothetical protein